jgi:hypothetical protein
MRSENSTTNKQASKEGLNNRDKHCRDIAFHAPCMIVDQMDATYTHTELEA